MITALGNTNSSNFLDFWHKFSNQKVQENKVDIMHVNFAEQDENIFKKPQGRIKYVDGRQQTI